MNFDSYTAEYNDKYCRWDYFGLTMRYVGFSEDHPFSEWVENTRTRMGWIDTLCSKEARRYFEKTAIEPLMRCEVYNLETGIK